MNLLKKNFGFTMVEVIIVIGLVGILGAVSGSYVVNSFKNSEILADKTVVQASVTSLMNDMGATIKEASIPVVEKKSEKEYVINQMKDNNEIVVHYIFDEDKKIVSRVANGNTITYENIENISITLLGQSGTENGAKITIDGEGNQYSLTSKYYSRNTVIACAHEWGEAILKVEPTCTKGGIKEMICNICGNAKEETIPALGHDLDEDKWEPDENNESTYHSQECQRNDCNVIVTEKHEFINDECKKCGYSKKDNNADDSKPGKDDSKPGKDDSESGKDEEIIECTEHNMAWARSEKNHYWACKTCGYVESAGEHSYEKDNITKETKLYRDSNNHYNKCTVCEYKANISPHEIMWAISTNSHYWACKTVGCGYVEEQEGHDLAYAKSQNKHYYACRVCGKIKEEGEHSLIWKSDTTQHYRYCEICEYSTTAENHNIKLAQSGTKHYNACNACGYVESQESHQFSWARSVTKHYYACNTCGYVESEGAHEFTNSVCTICGYYKNSAQASCEHKTLLATSETKHYYACEKCGNVESAGEHSYEKDNITKETELYCDSNNHYNKCTECEYKANISPHEIECTIGTDSHYWACKTVGCGYVEKQEGHDLAYAKSQNKHYNACRVCGKIKEEGEHSLIWRKSDATHYMECKVCQYTTDETQHKFNICHKCDICGYEKDKSVHNMIWARSEEKHYYTCETCGYVEKEEEHTELNGKCIYCNYMMTNGI